MVPAPGDPYNISEIKSDAKWLSAVANVNEVAALRVAVIEYHTRAHNHLTGPLSTQDVVNIQEAGGVSDSQASSIVALLNVSAVADAETLWAAFEKEESRRQRVLATYLSERRSFMSSADSLITFLLHSRAAKDSAVDALRRAIAKEAFGFDEEGAMDITVFEGLAPKYLGLLGPCIESSQSGPKTNDAKVMTEHLTVDWVRTALTEAIHAMSLSFQVVDLIGQAFALPEVITQWFTLMGTFDFLDPLFGVRFFHP